MSGIKRRTELDELEEIARVATRAALEAYEPVPPEWIKNLTLGTLFEDDHRIFQLYIAGERRQDSIIISSAKVNRKTRAVEVTITNLKKRSAS
jgi:hypothetical protein